LSNVYKSVLDYFEVDSQEELLQYMRDNPDNPKVKELNELIEVVGSDADER